MWEIIRCAMALAFAVSIGGCSQQPLELGQAALGMPAGPVQVSGAGFSVTLPSSAAPYDVGLQIPGATFQAAYKDDLAYLYIIYTIDAGSLAQFSGDENNASVRFDGTGRTSSGDFILLATVPAQYGDLAAVEAVLADGQWLCVGTDASNPARSIVFASIDLANTDGTSLEQNASGGVPLLVSTTNDGLIVLDDDSVYKIADVGDLDQVAGWASGDAVMPHGASDFFPSSPELVFLTKIGEYQSVVAEYIGTGESILVCPFVLDEDPLFTLTIPCGTVLRAEPSSEIPTADFESYYFDDQASEFYGVVTVAPESLPIYSTLGTAHTGISLRYDGTMQTSSGDRLVLATGHLQTGLWGKYAYGLLGDGRMLMVVTGKDNPLAGTFIASIDLAGTDGSNIGTAPVQGIPTLLAPAPDGLVVLNDNTAYRVSASTELQRLASWQAGATILVHDASLISALSPFFLTNRSEWVSIEADYVGVISQSTIETVIDPEFGAVELLLADGSNWGVAYGDEGEAKAWRAGDQVAVLEDSDSFLGHTMIRLSTGQTLVVEPK
jgi:hypothetical protein